MEYVYAALLLHRLKQDVTEDNVKNVIKATGTSPDEVKVKAPVAISAPPSAAPAPAQATAAESPASPKEEEKKEEEALEGLSSLFG